MRIIKEIPADTLTPISVYLRLKGKNKVILESIPRENDQSRFSIIALNPVKQVKFTDGVLTVNDEVVSTDEPLKFVEKLVCLADKNDEDNLPFTSGAIGYAGFDTYGIFEKIQPELIDEIGTPDLYFMLYENAIVFDHKREKLILVEDNIYSHRGEEALQAALTEKIEALSVLTEAEKRIPKLSKMNFTSNTTKKAFKEKVEAAKALIKNGDMFQIVLSQRLSADFTENPFDYYRQLRVENPSSYMYFLEFDDFHVIGSSPERLVAVHGNQVSTNPIAGTRKRGADEFEDQQLIEELENDQKEIAEHKMLVDLGRNDIGKLSEYGSISVPVFMKVEKYRYVMHITSEVKGQLRPEFSAMDALLATLPAGTLSGAPKHRAYQRIYEFEQDKRGIYGGAIGYLTKNGNCDFAIAIRTMILKNKKAHVQAGAGIVYDSVPELEYQETLNKARGLLEIGE
ncbi:anthranilate synthase component I [Lactococcus protaetiae]|uniref:Anthranilate synthase component 1 n=1 Tax=Lactococcus protaetiae TaxID=2592653 RepID=A0A514Z8U8_9LACT|nr:anthranilate synthase component I [Lactococcus protaetiae]QDK71021.1 anthranilate synthase component I [Lactococcus protaetiae]